MSTLRFGLVGTGHWARITHAPALASTPGVEFTAVWGRDPAAAAALAAAHGARAYQDVDALLAAVDAVSFAVPPGVQAGLAARAAGAGRHLLLEKPLAADLASAESVAEAVRAAGVASVVFFVTRFQPAVRAWLAAVAGQGPWLGGSAVWLGSGLSEGSPWASPWRREKGGLWDLGPHAISLLWAALGRVTSVTAVAGEAGLTHLVLGHDAGATSTVTVTLTAPEAADQDFDAWIWGEPGRSAAPTELSDPVPALRTALAELVAGAASGQPHECDARFGADVVRVIAAAERQLEDGGGYRW